MYVELRLVKMGDGTTVLALSRDRAGLAGGVGKERGREGKEGVVLVRMRRVVGEADGRGRGGRGSRGGVLGSKAGERSGRVVGENEGDADGSGCGSIISFGLEEDRED